MRKILLGILVILLFLTGLPQKIAHSNPSFAQEITPLDVKGWTVFTDPLFEKIAWCESNNIATAQNPYSTASGRFQFIDGTWAYYGQMLWGDDWINKDKLDYGHSTELAWYVYTHYGTTDWEADPASYNCWKNQIPNAVYNNII